ncbi:MAG TPA: hypothetical protein VLA05_02485 [Coriobacteriia bacterium]|nr:hypothetical protein [Coriobacteriia bacterium]
MILLLAKVLIAPLLLLASTFVAHRWGGAAGGWLLGLPLMSGPVSVLLFVEHGTGFARVAARGGLLGVVATGIFCVCYAVMASRENWWRSLLVAYSCCLGIVWLLAQVHLSFDASLVFALTALVLLAWLIGSPEHNREMATPPPASLAFRMLISSAGVFLITTSAVFLGAQVAGLLAPLPVVAAAMASSTHRRGEEEAAHGLLRGTLLGAWGGAGFFAVIGIALGQLTPFAAYAAATGAAVAAGGIAIRFRLARA